MSNSSIWPTDRTLPSATTPRESGPGSVRNEGVLHISKSSSINEALPPSCFVSYLGHSLRKYYLSVEMQSVYSASPADWATHHFISIFFLLWTQYHVILFVYILPEEKKLCNRYFFILLVDVNHNFKIFWSIANVMIYSKYIKIQRSLIFAVMNNWLILEAAQLI